MKPSDVPAAAPSSSGKRNLIRHLGGERLTQRQAILAKCCDCMGYYRDGRVDCGVASCALYPFMPYRKRAPPMSAEATTAPVAAVQSPPSLSGPFVIE